MLDIVEAVDAIRVVSAIWHQKEVIVKLADEVHTTGQ